jgi:hypothetical protein
MRRFIVLVTVMLVMTAMLALPALAAALRPPVAGSGSVGPPLPTVVCESPTAASPNIGWRNGQCWVFHP